MKRKILFLTTIAAVVMVTVVMMMIVNLKVVVRKMTLVRREGGEEDPDKEHLIFILVGLRRKVYLYSACYSVGSVTSLHVYLP